MAKAVFEFFYTAVFDTIDRNILLDHLSMWVGITGTALSCFYDSYLCYAHDVPLRICDNWGAFKSVYFAQLYTYKRHQCLDVS